MSNKKQKLKKAPSQLDLDLNLYLRHGISNIVIEAKYTRSELHAARTFYAQVKQHDPNAIPLITMVRAKRKALGRPRIQRAPGWDTYKLLDFCLPEQITETYFEAMFGDFQYEYFQHLSHGRVWTARVRRITFYAHVIYNIAWVAISWVKTLALR